MISNVQYKLLDILIRITLCDINILIFDKLSKFSSLTSSYNAVSNLITIKMSQQLN